MMNSVLSKEIVERLGWKFFGIATDGGTHSFVNGNPAKEKVLILSVNATNKFTPDDNTITIRRINPEFNFKENKEVRPIFQILHEGPCGSKEELIEILKHIEFHYDQS